MGFSWWVKVGGAYSVGVGFSWLAENVGGAYLVGGEAGWGFGWWAEKVGVV